MAQVRYLASATGSDDAAGTSITTAWRTFAFAIQQVQRLAQVVPAESVTVFVLPGTYTGVDLATAPMVSGQNSAPITFAFLDTFGGEAVIDGTGHRACIELWGIGYWVLDGLTFENKGGVGVGWSEVAGVSIRDKDNHIGPPGTGVGSHNITIQRCTFRNINRHADPTSYGAPVLFVSLANTAAGDTNCHNIQIIDCVFEDGLLSTPTINHSHIVTAGNVQDFLVSGCTFTHTDPTEVLGGIETGGNQTTTAEPDIQRGGVITQNTFIATVPTVNYAIYLQSTDGVLVERNYVNGWTYGIGVVTEPGTGPVIERCDHSWIRNNIIIDPGLIGMICGAFSPTYFEVRNVFITNNTVVRTNSGGGNPTVYLPANGVEGIAQDSAIKNNITVASDGPLLRSELVGAAADLLDGNYWVSPIVNAFVWAGGAAGPFPYATDQDTYAIKQTLAPPWASIFLNVATPPSGYRLRGDTWPSRNVGLTHVTPSWYVPGVFGPYEPAVELDYFGVPVPLTGPISAGATQGSGKPMSADAVQYGVGGPTNRSAP